MSVPTQRSRPAGHRAASSDPHLIAPEKAQPESTATASAAVTDARSVLVVAALFFRPSARRRGTLALVMRCPFCSTGSVSSTHAHRAGPSAVRRSGCDRGQYRLVADGRGWCA